jgi:hypothetical protein
MIRGNNIENAKRKLTLLDKLEKDCQAFCLVQRESAMLWVCREKSKIWRPHLVLSIRVAVHGLARRGNKRQTKLKLIRDQATISHHCSCPTPCQVLRVLKFSAVT